MFRRRRVELYERRDIRLPQLTHKEELLAQEISQMTGYPIAMVRRWMREQKMHQETER